jgi:uncharacterized membrane protein YkoI
MVDRKKLVAAAASAVILTLGVGTAVVAQQGALPEREDEPTINGTATQENEAEGSENEAGEGKDSDEALTGSRAREAADAALRATGGGTLLEVEQGDDPGAAYEVEVRKTDGGIAEVMLDGNLDVIDQSTGD